MTRFIYVLVLLLPGCGAGSRSTASPGGESASAHSTEEKSPEDWTAPSQGMVSVSVEDVLQQEDGAIIALIREQGGEARAVPIFIGEVEGRAIAMRLTRQKYLRPLTHDLIESVMGECGLDLVKVEIDDLKDNIFLAHLFIVAPDGRRRKIDARPSDAIAVALGMGAPIYIAVTIIEEISSLEPEKQDTPKTEDSPPIPMSGEEPLREI